MSFLGVPCSDEFGNANGTHGKSCCGSLGYAMVDAHFARKVVLLTEELVPFPNMPASLVQDQVDYIVQVESVGDPAKISVGAARVTSNPRELMIARYAADVIEHSGYFKNGFSMQTGSGAAATACTRFMEEKMERSGVKASFALGGITGSLVDLHEKGLIENCSIPSALTVRRQRRWRVTRTTWRSPPTFTPTPAAKRPAATSSTWLSSARWKSTSTSTSTSSPAPMA
jgi:citrate lyase subunit alpha/citrate CoA-transferase